jgi:hypothetical protein
MLTERMRAVLGDRANLIDTPLCLGDFDRTDPLPPAFRPLTSAALQRDFHVCRSCGFAAEEHQTTISLGGAEFDLSRLITVCALCKLAFNLSLTGAMRAGEMIWLPEFSQLELQHVFRDLCVAKYSWGPDAAVATACLDALRERSERVRAEFGTSDPAAFAGRFSSNGTDDNLGPLRLMPASRILTRKEGVLFNLFPTYLKSWFSRRTPSLLDIVQSSLSVVTPKSASDPSDEEMPPQVFESGSFSARRSPDDRAWEIFMTDGAHSNPRVVGRYIGEDYTLPPKLEAYMVHNLIAIMAGEPVPHTFDNLTRTRIVYQLFKDDVDTDDTRVRFLAFDGKVYWESANVYMERSLFKSDAGVDVG